MRARGNREGAWKKEIKKREYRSREIFSKLFFSLQIEVFLRVRVGKAGSRKSESGRIRPNNRSALFCLWNQGPWLWQAAAGRICTQLNKEKHLVLWGWDLLPLKLGWELNSQLAFIPLATQKVSFLNAACCFLVLMWFSVCLTSSGSWAGKIHSLSFHLLGQLSSPQACSG